MSPTTEAFSRVKIDALLKDAGWNLADGVSTFFEYPLPDGSRADYVLCDRAGRPLAAVEAKRAGVDPIAAQDQGRHYAEQLGVPFVFLSNGEEVLFLDRETDAHARRIATFYSPDDLERRIAARRNRLPLAGVEVDRRIVDREYQIACIEALSAEVSHGRRKLLVEMATGTGKTRTAAAFVKRLFEAGIVTRVLFLVDRIALAGQAEDAFNDHLRDYPCHVLRPGRGFDRTKRITIATLQTMITEYRDLSSGYFDLVITDECHRSIYGKWSGVLRHFDGIQLGLTATPCTAAEADMLPDAEDGHFVRDTLRFFGLKEPTFRYTLREAIGDGHLVPYRIYKAMTVKTAAEDGFEVAHKDLDWTAMDPAARAELEKLFEQSDPITVDPRALERTFTIPERNRAIVREFRDAHEKGFMGKDGIRRWPTWGKAIVFAVTKRHAETLAAMLDEHFADLKPHPATRYADFVVSDVGGGPAPDASAIIKRFKEEEFPKILVSVNMLDTGFDCPEVVSLVMARFTTSKILYRQMRGRGTRKAPHIGKTDFTIFDFVGVTEFHGDDDENIDGGREAPGPRPPGPGDPRMLLTLDVDDQIDPASRDWLSLDEHGRIVRTPEHETRASAVGLRFESWRGDQPFNTEQARWANLIGSRVRADAMHMDTFGDYDFDEHPFRGLGGYDQARRVFGGQSALDRLIAGFNAAVFGQAGASGSESRGDDRAVP